MEIDLNAGLSKGGKFTRVNKKNNIHKNTKKQNKNNYKLTKGHKLTKRNKKIKIHKTTRKSV